MLSCGNNYDTSLSVKVIGLSTPIAGTYTLNSNAPATNNNFNTWDEFTNVINCVGVNGPFTLEIDTSYPDIDKPIVINAINGASDTNWVTIKANGLMVKGAINPLVWLKGASYLTLDSIWVKANPTYGGIGIYLNSNCKFVTIKNSKVEMDINGGSSSTSCAAIAACTNVSTPTTSGGINARNLTITNNQIIGGYFGLCLVGASPFANNYGHVISNNQFDDQFYNGIYLNYADTCIVEKNIFQRKNSTLSTSFYYGVNFSFSRNFNCTKNIVKNVQRVTGSFNGINLSNGSSTAYAMQSFITNNLVYNSVSANNFHGIYCTGFSGLTIAHNTVIKNFNSITGTNSYGVYLGLAQNLTHLNNLYVMSGSFTGNKFGIYHANANPVGFVSNKNLYRIVTSSLNNVGYYNSAARPTLANWQTTTLTDSGSITTDPYFKDTLNELYIPQASAVDNLGNFAGVTKDILDSARSLTTPDIGAYEFTGIGGDLALTEIRTSRSSICYSTQDTIRFKVKNMLTNNINLASDSITVQWNINGPVQSTGSVTLKTGTLNGGDSVIIWSRNANFSKPGNYTIKANLMASNTNAVLFNDTTNGTNQIVQILTVSPKTYTANTSTDTVLVDAISNNITNAEVYISEVCHFKSTTGQPALTWAIAAPYLIADDYIELTSAPFSNLSNYRVEIWNSTSFFASGNLGGNVQTGPNGTLILATGSLNGGVEQPASFYFHAPFAATTGLTSTIGVGYVIKNPSGAIVDAVSYGNFTFPANANVNAAQWSGVTTASGSGITLISMGNTGLDWVNSSLTLQTPNVLNAGVTLPFKPKTSGFSWKLNGVVVDSFPQNYLGPWTTPGVYNYVAELNLGCGTYYDTVTVTATSTVPVKLLGFNANKFNQDVKLKWSTASEFNSQYFEVFASNNNQNFVSVGKVAAAGNSFNVKKYQLIHKDALALNNAMYYKLKMVDIDGKYTWSQTELVGKPNLNTVVVAPNPFINELRLTLVNQSPALVELLDLNGKTLYKQMFTVNNGSIILTDLAPLNQGIYLLKTTQNEQVTFTKVLKQ